MATVRTACNHTMLLDPHFGARARRCGATACGGEERSRPRSRTPTATAAAAPRAPKGPSAALATPTTPCL